MTSKYLFIVMILGSFLMACKSDMPIVYATVETTPVKSEDDAADDSAIYLHPNNPEKHVVIATNKQSGLSVYRLDGSLHKSYPIGRINNVDIRTNVRFNGSDIVVVGGSNRSDNSIILYQWLPDQMELKNIAARPLKSKVEEVYGFCMYQNEKTYAIVVGKDGVVEQWELLPITTGKMDAKIVRSFDVGEQCEGLVADDELGHLYVGEEEVGIWKYSAEPDGSTKRTQVDLVKQNNQLKMDIEGLCLYYAANGEGYLIASSQGNHSYAIYNRSGNNTYIGSFRIGDSDQIDSTYDTDGIDVINVAVNKTFPNGFFIAQDGKNTLAKQTQNQNFKLVSWEVIAKAFQPELRIDNTYKVVSGRNPLSDN